MNDLVPFRVTGAIGGLLSAFLPRDDAPVLVDDNEQEHREMSNEPTHALTRLIP